MLRPIGVAVWVAALAFAQAPLPYEIRHVEKKSPGCLVSFDYPEITSAAPSEVRHGINAGILEVLLRRSDWPGSDSGNRTLDEYANSFLRYCEEVRASSQEFKNRDLYERKTVRFFRSRPPIFSFQCVADADGGGVHPFGTSYYLNFDSQTGRRVKLTGILRPGAMAKLESRAESRFRGDRKLSATESLSEAGFNFPGDRFKLNDNFGLGDKALVFHFNTYEIAAGAMGDTEIEIPYADIRDLLNSSWNL